jgi:1-acyl-sn-glycerol-3-phosphate acyltransferase
MRTLRSIARCTLLILVTLTFYLLLIVVLFGIFPFRRVAYRWRSWILRHWSKSVCGITRIQTSITGASPEPPFFLVSNHLSYVDVFVLGSILDCVFIARSDVRNWPVVGLLCRGVGTIFVDRDHRSDVVRVNDIIGKALSDGRGVVLFAEGTSTKGESVGPFKSSLLELPARTSFPVSYAALTYDVDVSDPPAHLSVCWWGDMMFLSHAIALTRLKRIEAKVAFGSGRIVDLNRKALAAKLRAAVNEQFEPVVQPDSERSELRH